MTPLPDLRALIRGLGDRPRPARLQSETASTASRALPTADEILAACAALPDPLPPGILIGELHGAQVYLRPELRDVILCAPRGAPPRSPWRVSVDHPLLAGTALGEHAGRLLAAYDAAIVGA